ncbi:hypothetical protein LA76x_0522 [Lysobacter antibioticus]|uniref:Uncharacterized protein n=1 Tax=Lysobacter antibioticus TaxID=84531 RepID=A0A0S2F574_LYSAN|nr:hypothetical protein LA76x_0522 [Lysobacter antibioticus]
MSIINPLADPGPRGSGNEKTVDSVPFGKNFLIVRGCPAFASCSE